ncbi:hypothetical protein LTR65_007859 [Meristemomyces frigidus]
MERFTIGKTYFIAVKNASVDFAVRDSNQQRLGVAQGSPVTVLALGKDTQPDRDFLQAELQALLASDDVICPGFTATILLLGSETPVEMGNSGRDFCQSRGCELYAIETTAPIRSGPYYVTGSELRRVYRLQEDPNKAFVMGVVPDNGDPAA